MEDVSPQNSPELNQIIKQKNNFNWWRTITIGFGIASVGIAIAVGGYILGTQKSQPPIEKACTMEAKLCPDGTSVGRTGPKCEFSPCPTPTIDPTANWKTYSNSTYGYSIKYPSDFIYELQTSDTFLSLANFKNPSATQSNGFYIEVRNLDNLETAVNFERSRIVGHSSDKINKETKITKDGFEAVKLEYSTSDNKDFTTLIVNGDKYTYMINAPTNLFNQILSTFKFTGQSQTVDETANWKTYTNQGLKFSIKYPSSWSEKGPVSDSDNTIVYLNADESFGQGPEPVRYYIWIAADALPNVKLTEESVGEYTIYKTDELPSRSGALTSFITNDDKKYISISLTPYDLEQTFPSQDKYIDIYNKILSTFKFTQ